MVTDPSCVGYIGALSCDNYTAELSAVAWAMLVGLRLAHHSSTVVAVQVHYDNLAAANNVSGVWVPNAEKVMVAMVALLFKAISTLAPFSLCHVKGHSGNPWNIRLMR